MKWRAYDYLPGFWAEAYTAQVPQPTVGAVGRPHYNIFRPPCQVWGIPYGGMVIHHWETVILTIDFGSWPCYNMIDLLGRGFLIFTPPSQWAIKGGYDYEIISNTLVRWSGSESHHCGVSSREPSEMVLEPIRKRTHLARPMWSDSWLWGLQIRRCGQYTANLAPTPLQI